MNNTSYDVIVVGAGNAALCAALSAREQGANVLVLERAPQEQRGGNSAFTGVGSSIINASGGGLGLINAQFKAVEKQGIAVRYSTRAKSLLRGRAGVEGVRVIADGSEEQIRARTVVLACGGFEANREWRTRYLGSGWDLAKVRGTRYNTGDGIRMALKIGDQPFGNWSGAHACEWDLNAPEYGDVAVGDNFGKHSYHYGIVINADGVRFVDEGADLRAHTYAKYGRMILKQPGQSAWQIFDSKVLSLLRSSYHVKKVTKVTANTLEELASKLDGVNKEQALRTINYPGGSGLMNGAVFGRVAGENAGHYVVRR